MATPTSLPATFVAGNVLTAAQMNDLRGAFRILQVVQATYGTAETTTSATYVDTSLTATITPSSTTSKILVLCNVNFQQKSGGSGTSTGSAYHAIERGGSQIYEHPTGFVFHTTSFESRLANTCTLSYLDSPATTSATTYTLQHKTSKTLVTFDGDNVATLILLEVSA